MRLLQNICYMRTIKLMAALMAVVVSGAASAQTVQGSVDEGFVIKAGNVTMTVSAKEGGKIMSYKYDDKEMLSQLRMRNQYGSTFWTSPQKEWNWPPVTEFDRAAYTDETDAIFKGSMLRLMSQTGRKLPFQIEKLYIPDPNGKYIKVLYTIYNRGDVEEEVKKNPWQKWVFKKGIVTNDFVNTSSNVVVVTFLDYEGAAQNDVSDIKTIRDKYKLCCVLHPGDKYVETHDGKNGFRFARYLQAHSFCKYAKLDYGLKYMDFRDFDRDGIGNWEEIKGINLKLKINNNIEEKQIFTNPNNKDSDDDGIKDGDEVHGKNGFVTDPTNPDTDGDGIPDNEDKNPLISCKSSNPQIMPIEWAEYWSKGDQTLLKKLIPVNGDCDNDGFTNSEEKLMETDPTVPNKGKIIVFPKHLVLNNICDDKYEGEFNVLINTNVMTEISLSTGSWNQPSKNYPGIKYITSTPLRKEMFKWKSLYSEAVRDSKPHHKFAVVQPMTIHKFKLSYKKDGWFKDLHLLISCYNVDHSEDNYKLIARKTLEFRTQFDKFYMPERIPEVPKIVKPSPDYYFFSKELIDCEWTDTNIHYPWRSSLLVKHLQRNKVFLDKNFIYQDNYGRYGLGTDSSWMKVVQS